jgi:putative transcription factor
MICEMCGNDVEGLQRVRVEGSVLELCADCSKFGTVIAPMPGATAAAPPPAQRPGSVASMSAIDDRVRARAGRLQERDLYRELPDMELAPEWGKRIRVAREHLTWTPEDLAKKLNEKKSVVLKLESGGFRPPDAIIRKVEHLLKIRLRADPEPTA